MALTTVTLHGQILDPDGLTPAVGTVTFRTLIELRDVVDNIVYTPAEYSVTLDLNGEFTIVLPATDNPDITPLNWVYQVYISTAAWRVTQYIQLPFAPGTTELADLTLLDYDPCTGIIASTPIPPDDAALFVLKAGDTMTGNLILNANLQVSGDANVDGSLTAEYQGFNGDVMRLLATVASTGIVSGGLLTPNADPTKVDIAAMTGWIVDYNASGVFGPTNPKITYVTWPGQVGIIPAFTSTWFMIDSAGTLVQQSTRPTPAQRRQNVVLGTCISSGGVIVQINVVPGIQSQPLHQYQDLTEALAAFSTSGNQLSPNGVNLTFNKSTGTIFFRAFNLAANYQDPNNSTLVAQTPTQFRHITALPASSGPLTSILDVANYDPSGLGVLTPVGGGVNTSTNFRVWISANPTVSSQMLVQYGQNTYSSLANAVAGIGTGTYIPNPIVAAASLLGWISVIRTATDLSNPAQATFTQAGKFALP